MAAGTFAGTAWVQIIPQTAGFGSALSAAVKPQIAAVERSLSSRIGSAASGVGTALTRFVTVPLAIAGTAAVSMAVKFDAAFVKIQALAGHTGQSLDQMKASVLALAGQTAQSPQDLADALYFVASAGAKASDVMPILKSSAEGAAAGLGSVQDIAQTLTSVLNAYSGTGLTAANAMNIFTQAAKSGKAEVSDFATGLGPVISVAAQAGISLNDLAAAIAQATNAGVPFDRAVTASRFLIQSLTVPTAKSAAALKDLGIGQNQLATQLQQPGGLETALQNIHDKLDLTTASGRAAWAAIVGGARGAILASTLVGNQMAHTNAIVRDLGTAAQDSSTVFEQALSKMTKTDAFKFKQALVDLQVAAVQLGQKLLPVARQIIGFISGLVDKFSSLSPGVQGTIIKFAGLLLVLGPVLRILGPMVGLLGGVARGLSGAGAAAGAAGAAAGASVPAWAALAAVGVAVATAWAVVTVKQTGVAASTVKNSWIVSDAVNKYTGLAVQLGINSTAFKFLGAAIANNDRISVKQAQTIGTVVAGLRNMGVALGPKLLGEIRNLASQGADANAILGILATKENVAAARARALANDMNITADRTNEMTGRALAASNALNREGSSASGATPKIRGAGSAAATTGGQARTASGSVNALAAALQKFQGTYTANIITHYINIGSPPPGSPGFVHGRQVAVAAGGIFPKYAGGQVFTAPFGNFIAGEGSYSTPLGTGAEIVTNRGVEPLSANHLQTIAGYIAKEIGNGGRQAKHREPIVVNVMLDRRVLARAVADQALWDE